METVQIFINHDPVSWTAPRLGRWGCYSAHSRQTQAFQWFIKDQYKDKPIQGYVWLDFTFSFAYPKSATKKEKLLMDAGKIYPTKKDVTNLQKFAEDCLKKIVIEDDRNVVQITSKKLYAYIGSVIIKVTKLEEREENSI